jgi:hypothetical protein
MQQNKSSEPINRTRTEVFGLTYIPHNLQNAHERSLARTSSAADDSKLFSQYMSNLRVKQVRK